MMNIIFGILVYLIAGCAYCLMVWILFRNEILKEQNETARAYGFPGTTTSMLIINMIETMIIWPYFWVRFMYNIVKNT